jgi:hypothetical protein
LFWIDSLLESKLKDDAAAGFDESIGPPTGRWSRRDFLACGVLFLLTGGFILWQNSQLAILWDLSYLLDTSWRIALGQMPYRDFPLVHAPGTFLIQAAIMRVAGRHYELQIVYAAIVGGLGTVFAWRILLHALSERVAYAWIVSLMLAAPLTALGIYSVYFHPIYDCDCAFAILVAIFFLQRLNTGRSSNHHAWVWAAAAGFFTVVPVFFKQNMGLPFLLAVAGSILLIPAMRVVQKKRGESAQLLMTLAGMMAAMVAAFVFIQLTAGLDNYLHWTVHFAASRRLPGIGEMLSVYRQPSFIWTLPCALGGLMILLLPIRRRIWGRVSAVCLFAAPLVGSLIYLVLNDDLDERADNLLALWPMLLILCAFVALLEMRKGIALGRMIPFMALAAIHGAFLSQQLWGSTYAIWPLLIILIAYALAAIPKVLATVPLILAAIVCTTFLVCGGLYAAGHERMNYLRPADGPVLHATVLALRGMADPGPALPDFEDLIQFANNEIPAQDAILLLPGEEPFYFATGRTPQFPVQIFDNTTDPYSPEVLLAEARNRNVCWIIVKTRLQSDEDPLPERAATLQLVAQEFLLYRKLSAYDVYRRR